MEIVFVGQSGAPAIFRKLRTWLASLSSSQKTDSEGGGTVTRGPALSLVRGSNPGTGCRGGQRLAQPASRPLRVLRVIDSHHAPADAGRMLISGRMADVCAELERLASHESAVAMPCVRRQA